MAKSKHLGFALPAVLGILALTSLACAVVWRMQWAQQQLLQAHTHLMRNQHIADGVLPVVVQDIIGPSATDVLFDGASDGRHSAGTDLQTHAFYPSTPSERDKLQLRLGASMCQAGICAPKTLVNLSADQWRNLVDQSQGVSASHLPSSAVSAFYWVEVWMNANASVQANSPVTPSPFIYRITVLVQENAAASASRPATLAMSFSPQPSSIVLQAIWSRATPSASTGQWHSWKLLA